MVDEATDLGALSGPPPGLPTTPVDVTVDIKSEVTNKISQYII